MNTQSSPPNCTCQKENLSISRKSMWIALAGVLVTAVVGWLAYSKDEGATFQQNIKQTGDGNQAGLLNIKWGGTEASEEPKNSKSGKIQTIERPEFKPRTGGGPSWVF